MLSFNKLNESFDKIAPWQKIVDKPRKQIYSWKIDGHKYELVAENIIADIGLWKIKFTIENPNKPGEQTTDATGTGNEMSVFATVMNIIIKDFIPTVNPEKMYIAATKSEQGKSSNRSRLYGKLLKRFLSKDWTIKEKDSNRTIDFFLVKK